MCSEHLSVRQDLHALLLLVVLLDFLTDKALGGRSSSIARQAQQGNGDEDIITIISSICCIMTVACNS